MKTTLKWVGWGLLGLVILAIFLGADKMTQWGIGIIGVICWFVHDAEKRAEKRREMMDYRLQQLEKKLDEILSHPLNSTYIADGIEGMVNEYRDRQRAGDSDSHRP